MARPPPYPLFLNLDQRPVLIVGGGSVALRKARSLIECHARVTVVSPQFTPGFEKLAGVELLSAPYASSHMIHAPWRLVFAATNLPEVNAQVHAHATAAGILCSRADEPEEGDFSSGASQRIHAATTSDDAQVNATPLILAVSTTGTSPPLAARICREAAASIDPLLPLLANLLSNWRTQVKSAIADANIRRALLQKLAGPEMETTLRQNGPAAAQLFFQKWLTEAQQSTDTATKTPTPSRTVNHAH